MKKLFLFLLLTLSTASFAQSTNALVIRSQSDKTLITVKLPNPNIALSANQGADPLTTHNTQILTLPTDVQAAIALYLTTGIHDANGNVIPLGSNLIVLWSSGSNWVVTVIPDNGSPCSGSCSYVAFTSSLNSIMPLNMMGV